MGEWWLDLCVVVDEQIGLGVYVCNDFDWGYLVCCCDFGWGLVEMVREVSEVIFFYLNVVFQVVGFNQFKELWFGLEDYVFLYVEMMDQCVSVFMVLVFDVVDLLYCGIWILL